MIDIAGEMISGGIVAACVIGFVQWRLARLEKCIDRAHGRIDSHLAGGES